MTKKQLEYSKFRAWIEVDNKKVECNAVDTNRKDRETSCWIASKVGKEFVIRFSKEETRCHCRVSIILDNKVVARRHFKKGQAMTYDFDSVKTSINTERPFVFTPLQVTDDDNALESDLLNKPNPQLGEIKVKVHRVTNLGYEKRCRTEPNPEAENVPEMRKVHETTRKARVMMHQIGYGEKRERAQASHVSFRSEAVCDVHERLVTFLFSYRPLMDIQSRSLHTGEPTLHEIPSCLEELHEQETHHEYESAIVGDQQVQVQKQPIEEEKKTKLKIKTEAFKYKEEDVKSGIPGVAVQDDQKPFLGLLKTEIDAKFPITSFSPGNEERKRKSTQLLNPGSMTKKIKLEEIVSHSSRKPSKSKEIVDLTSD